MTTHSLDITELLDQWNNHSTPEWTSTVPALFAAQCETTPDAVAVVHGDRRLTYRELGERAAQLANTLHDTNFRAEGMVAVGVPRSAEMVVCVLAAMIAGAAFVPLDPAWPAHRRGQVLADAGASAAFVAADDQSHWDVPTLVVDLDDWRHDGKPTQPPAVSVQPTQLAYVIFTSGSTGKPKGAMIRHDAITERLLWQRDHILHFGKDGRDDAALFKAPLSFDISVNEILLPLISGGRVVVAEPDGEKDPEYLLDLIRTQRVTFVYLVSSMLDTLLELDRLTRSDSLASLRHVWCGGEVLTPGLFARFRAQLSTTLYHGYGPAEATIGVSHVIYRDTAERIATSIGKPNPHTQLYVLDDDMRPVPPGVGGELYAAGFLLGRGYVNAPSLTASRFVANPFDETGSRMYRTGDLARWTGDGSLEFLGRADNQVKIRGRRIELEEIESQLADHPAVRQAVVTVHQHGGAEQLVGYLVTVDGITNDAALHGEVAAWSRSRLPDYMVPTLFVGLDRVPVTANGKVDRRALPAPDVAGSRTVNPPRTPRETVLCEAFADALGLDEIGVDEDFFRLGGDSIVAIRVVSRVRASGFALRPRDMFAHRTVEALAPLLVESAAVETFSDTIDPIGPAAATPILRWLDDVAGPGSVLHGFYQAMSLITPDDLDDDTLRAALGATLARHQALWAMTDGRAAALNIPQAPPEIHVTTVDLADDADLSAAVRRLRDELVTALDPAAGGMVTFGWLRRPMQPGRLVVVAHHIVVDGISLRIVAEDLAAAHRLIATGQTPALPAVETSWRSWAQRLTDAAAAGVFDDDLDYWQRVCATAETAWGDEPLDAARDTVATEARLTVELPAAVTDAVLTQVPDRIHGHVNDAMVAALYLALREWRDSRGSDQAGPLLLEMEGHGREGHFARTRGGSQGQVDADLSSTVGWFTTLYPVALHDDEFDWRTALSNGASLGAAVRSIKDQLRSVPSHGLSYGALRYLRGASEATGEGFGASLDATPQVLFNYLGRFDTADRPWALADDHVAVMEDRDPAMPLPRLLEVNAEAVATTHGTVLRATFSWPSAAVAEAEIAFVARRWTELLTAIANSADVRGHSVSDFPRVTLDANDVTELENAYPGLADVLPLTPTQQGIYFHSTFSRRHDPYVVQQIVDITGPLDTDSFQRATEAVVNRHRSLSAAFATLSNGTPVAVHATPVAPDFEVVDARADADSTRVVAQRAEWDRNRRFDLAAPPLSRYTLIRRTDDVHTMVQTVHHIVADGWSVPIVLDDLLTAYAGADFTSPAPQFAQFVDWLGERNGDADRAAWAGVLDGISEPTRISSADGTRGLSLAASSTGFGTRSITLPSRTVVVAAAGRAAVTIGTWVHTAWGVTVGRLTGEDDVVFGTVVSGRGGALEGVDRMVGLLVNTVPVRVRWSPTDTAMDVATRLAGVESEVVEHHHLPLTEAHQIAGVGELFDSLVVIENLGTSSHSAGDLTLGEIGVIEAPHYPLTVMIAVHDTVTVTVTNDRGRVSDTFADAATKAFADLLTAVTSDPGTSVGDVELGRQAEPVAGPPPTTVTALISDAIGAHRDDVAVVAAEGTSTFGELDSRAGTLARQLVDAGVRRGDVVALALSRSTDAVAAMWAIISVGAAYLPVDPTYPRARLEFMLAHARPRAVLVDDIGRVALDGVIPVGTATVDTTLVAGASWPFQPVDVGPLDAVSVLYTSGSTGEPKAVVGTHGALANRLSWAIAAWPAATRLAKSSLSFIDGTTELLAGIAGGARTVLADDASARDGRRLAELIAAYDVSQLVAVPSLASALADAHCADARGVRRWIVSGEPLESVHVAALCSVTPDAAIVNSYGSSEVAGDVLAGELSGDGITLGAPVAGTGIHILDSALRELPTGVIGEIYASGVQLARGYLHRPGQTATRFVAAPDGGRMYRTGDLGARLPDGRVTFAGRADGQLKVNGHRVEPGEVEAALTRRSDVLDAAVVGTGSTLAAFVVLDAGGPPADELLTGLGDQLPRHLVPTSIQPIDAIPLLPNGKRDTATLRARVGRVDSSPAELLAPVDDVQRAIVDVVADVLGRDAVGADADFFALGGDSIAAIRVTSRLARAGYHVTIEDVFRRRTAIGLAALLAETPVADTGPRQAIPRFGTVRLSAETIDAITEGGAVEDIWAMSPLQQGVYYQSTLGDAGAPTYIAQNTFEFDRRIDVDAMQQAFTALLRRHPQLRAGFRTVEHAEAQPVADATAMVQVVIADPRSDITVVDLSATPDAEEGARHTADHDRIAPFDVATPPLLRLTVIRLPDGRDRMLFTYHFLLFDGWSRELVLRELFALYDSHRRGGPAEGRVVPHGDLVLQYLEWLRAVDDGDASAAWATLLAGLTEPTLATGVEPGQPDAAADTEPGRIVVRVPEHVTDRLRSRATELGVTLNAVITTAVSTVTGYHAGTSDVVIGITVAGRPGELVGIDETIGLFLNTVPVRLDLSPTRTAAEAMHAVNDQRMSMMRHDHLGLGQIQRAAGDSGRALFDSLLVLQNFLDDDTFTDLETAHGIVGVDYHDTTHFPLTWVLTPGRELTVKLEHRVVDDQRAREMVDQLLAVFDAIAASPDVAIGATDLVSPRRRTELERRWSATERPFEPVTIAELLARRAELNPDDVALVFGAQQLSYRQFDDRVSQLARYLRAHGAAPESFVALALPRSIDMVVALFAVLRAGAAYLPLELDLPIDRLRTIVDDARPVLLLTTSERTELADCARGHGATVITTDDPGTLAELAATSTDPLTADELGDFATGAQRLQHPAYLIYTSGSTGRPKGVLTGYAGLTNMYYNHQEAIFQPSVARARAAGSGQQITVAHTVSFSFDMSWEELFWLVEGHQVHVCDEELRRDAPALVAYCHRHRVDVINVTPTYAHHLLDAGLLVGGHTPALVLLGGEAVGDGVWSALRDNPATAGYNLYGPTEYTINTLGGGTDDSVTPTVGQPIWNTRGYILDAALRPVPDGATGELYIAGAGLARGYHHRPGLTANAMIADPYVPGGRMYRTGDLVRLRPGSVEPGILDYLGRADDQVKIRGYRIELGEVESVLATADGVARCAVVVRAGTGTHAVKTLAAYVVPAAGLTDEAQFIAGLRDHLADKLPAYMVPARYGVVDALPLTINGKLDVAALPEPVAATRGATRAPRTTVEATLLEVVATVLGIEVGGLSVDDDFFALGGDSISSIAVCGRARKAGLHITPRDVFRRRTVAALAAVTRADTVHCDVEPDTGVGIISATPMLAETEQSVTPLDNFFQSMVLATPAGITGEQLELVLRSVIDAHGMLRARLEVGDAGWTLTVPEPGIYPDRLLTRRPGALTPVDVAESTAGAAAELAPHDGVMVRAVWYESGQLLLVIHHLVIDGVSWRIIGDDLAKAWADVATNGTPTLDEVPTSFHTWSKTIAEARFDAEADHWNDVLTTADPDLGSRPLDPAIDTADTVRSRTVSLPAAISSALLTSVPAAMNGGVNDVLLTALSLALARWRADRGQDDGTATALNVEGHGREADLVAGPGRAKRRGDEHSLDLSRTIGWFTAIYPVRIDPGPLSWSDVLSAGAPLAEAAKSVKEQLRTVPNRGLGYGVLRYLDGSSPIHGVPPQILFNYLGRFAGGSGRDWEAVAEIGALREGVDPSNPAVALEINALAEDRPNGTVLTMTLAWPGGLLDDTDVDQLAALWAEALTALTRCDDLAGHTPSDFPLVEITQADVDDWERTGAIDDVLPLLPLQEGMYFHSTYGEGVDTYQVQQIAELSGPVDPDIMRASVSGVVARHQALRASFREIADGRLAQVIWADVAIDFQTRDAYAVELNDIAAEQLSHPLDLANAPLVRYTLVKLGVDDHRLIQTMHHIVADGWSYPVIFGDVVEHYNASVGAGNGLDSLTVSLRDHIEAVTGGDRASAREAWATALAEVAPTTLIPSKHGVGEHRSAVRRLSPDLTRALTQAARGRGVTLSTVLHGAWGLLLGRLLDRQRVVFGSTVSGRGGELSGTESIVGLLINTIPVPMSWQHDTSIADAMTQLQDQQSALLDAQQLGLAELARLAGVRDFFDTMVVVENFPSVATDVPDHPRALRFHGFTGTDSPHYPVSFVAYLDDQLTIEIKYDAGAVTAPQADRYAERVERILTAFVEQADALVGGIDLRTAAEHELVAGSESRPGPDRTLADAFTAAAHRSPAAVAVTCGQDQISYAELDSRTTAVATTLIDLGVRPESRVAVALPRSIDLIVGLLAVIRAGGTYVPLDIDSPAARLQHILDDSAPVCVLTDRADRVSGSAPTVILHDAALRIVDGSLPATGLTPDHAAYVIYTSGSTGLPKGVAVTHRDVAALFQAASEGAAAPFAFGPDDVWTMFHSAAFDFSVWELWGPLLFGGRLVVAEQVVARDPDRFVALLSSERVTVLNQTPSAFYPLIEADRREHPELALRYVIFGGEALDVSRLSPWYERHDAQSPLLVNMYGITETCVHVSHRALDAADAERSTSGPSVIGDPLPGLRIHLLDNNLRPVPIGVIGEMYIAGGQLARGYVGRPELTAGRFVANPFDSSGERLYRSGDTAMWTESGELVYVGRSDQQVKVRGYRIELGEVESALAALPQIANAAAAVRHDDTGRTRLIGYLVGREAVDVGQVRADLGQRLPDYMVPSTLVVLDALPLTVNGKLDRDALPEPAEKPAPSTAPVVTAGTGTADMLAALCTEILGTRVGIDDDFFTMGGDSIVAIQLVNRVRRLGLRITPQQVFVNRTPAALAAAAVEGAPAAATADDSGPDLGEVMLTPIVQRLAELGGTVDRFNQAELLRTPVGVTHEQLDAAINAVIARHDALRVRLNRPVPMLWSLETTATSTFSLLRVDAAAMTAGELRDAIGTQSDAAADRLDPDAGVVVQAVWFDLGPDRQGRLLLVVHHLAVDGVSWRILIEDLGEACQRLQAGQRVALAPVPTSIRAYARAVNENAQRAARLAEFEHWTSTLAPGGELDPATNVVTLTVGSTRDHEVRLTAAETVPLLTSVPAMANADVTDTLVAALHVAVVRWRVARGGSPDAPLVLDLERHGRDGWGDDLDLSRTVGWFTAIAPVRLPASQRGDGYVATLKDVKERLRTAPDGGLGFGQLRYCNPRTAAALGRLAPPQLLFNYLGRWAADGSSDWDSAPEVDALRAGPDPDLGTPYLLEVNAICDETVDGPRLRATLTYADGELSADAVAELGEHWVAELRELGELGSRTDADSALTPSDLPLVELSQRQIDALTTAAPYPVEAIWPLSPLQEGVYFQARYATAAVYIVQNVFDFTDPVDVEALQTAYSSVMRRNPVLRSGFWGDDLPQPVAAIAVDPVCRPELIDLTGLQPDALVDRIAEITAADRLRTFDLTAPPLARMTVIRTGGNDRLIFSYHFLLLDGWSREQLLRELFAEYTATRQGTRADLPAPSADFTDYLRWLAGRDRSASAHRWAEALADLAAPTLLVPDAVGAEPTLAQRLDFTLTDEQTARLVQSARRSGVTLNALISTGLALVLAYETGSDDVVFGSTVAGRPTDLDGIDSVIGLFLNTVPTRVRLRPDRSVADTMRAVQSDRLHLMDHEYLGLGDIQRAVTDRDRKVNGDNGALSGGGPLFDSLYVLQNFLDDDTFTDMETVHGIVGHDSIDASHYPLTWVASPGRRLWVKLEYRPDVVDRARARRLLDRLRQVLLHLARGERSDGEGTGDTDMLAAVPMVLPDEGDALQARAGSTLHELPDVTVMDLLAERAGAAGPATSSHRESAALTALVCGGDSIDYGQLDDRMNRLAWVLRDRGIGPECTVALAIPRSIDAVVALFAVLRAGAAYLPLELDYPDDRLTVMLDDAAPVCVLTTRATAPRIAGVASEACPVVVLDDTEVLSACQAAPSGWDGYSPGLDEPAYVIYTSGSTGKPKGVVTPHRGLTNMHLNHREAIFAPAIAKAGGRRLRIAHTVSFSFDMSWEELLWLVEGHEVHVCDEELRRDATALVAYCHQHEIDVINVTPTYGQLLFEEGLLKGEDQGGHPPVLVLLGGEAVSTAVWNRLRDSDTSYGYNLYGPTEYTINTLGGGTDDSATPTVGQPIWNTRDHVLDGWLRPVPDGIAGELYISGAGLARGYLGQPALSAGRFVAGPFDAGNRMYRTGDLVIRRPDGNLDFLGRTDDQVKIRGYRVELGDIESAVSAHPLVAQAAVIARTDPNAPGTQRLVGYVVPAGALPPDFISELRSHLKSVLPTYMVPTAIAVLDELPLTDNGKLNVRALPDVAPSSQQHSSRAPRTPAEETLCEIFAEVLGFDAGGRVGIDDDYFDLGGHSLLSIRLISRVRAALGVELSLGDVFNARTVAGLAERLESGQAAVARLELVAVPRPERIPASPAQERLLVLERIGETGVAYNYPLAFTVRGALNLAALGRAVTDVIAKHETLRTVFAEHDGLLFQEILPVGTTAPTHVVDCADADVDAKVTAAAEYQFDLSSEIPVRVTVFRTAADDHTVLLLMHHIATDEWSDTPFVDDLNDAYRLRVAGDGTALPALPVQYADYTLWQRELLERIGEQQRQFWRTTLADAPDELTLPTDRPRPTRASGNGGTLQVEIPPETAAALRVLAAERQVSMLMALHGAVAVLLHRLGAGDDIVVGTPVAGRDETALHDVVGFFVNTVVLRADVSGNPSFEELLARVRTADLAAFAHQELPFERLVEELNPPRVAGRNPLFNVFVGYHLRDGEDTEMFGLPTQWSEPLVTAAMFDLGFTLIDERADGRATIMAEFSSDLFDESSVRRLTERLATILRQVAGDSAVAIGAIDLLGPDELDDLIAVRNDTDHFVGFHDLAGSVTRQARRTPDATAVVFDGRELSYAELDAWSDRLAARLVADGARRGAVVGVALPRSIELIVALVAVAKSGAAFLALDPDYPSERLAYMLDDAKPAAVLDDPAVVLAARDAQSPWRAPNVDPAGWAYVLYTSGSTGRPKGVAVPQAGIVNRIAWLQHAYPLTADDRMLVKTPISFDTSVWEVFWPLSVGAALVVARPGGHRDPGYLAETIVSQRVTAVDFVPSMLELFLEDSRAAQCTSLTRVTVGGEALSPEVANKFANAFAADVPLHNLYGPTEASVDALGWTADGGPVALGVPGWNVRAYVLDGYLNPVPAGAPGELYLAGVQLADGYLHRHDLTAQSFVANPFGDGARMYRTGDVVRWRGRQLEYLGRTDDQIKLRGVRIEPGEIEAVLTTHPAVSSARVVVRNDRLVAYYLPADGPSPAASLREYATAALPIHMVPSAFVELSGFPLTPSGKLDRRALPDPQIDAGAGRPPATAQQQRLCELFSEVLGTSITSIDADFFALGGHSLLLVRLAATIRREFGIDVPVADLMVAPTVVDVAIRLSSGTDGTAGSLAPVLPLRPSGSQPPLFCVHPASGLSWQFAGLKRHLPQDVPMYGLQSPLFTGGRLPDTIGELASDYADTVAEIAPIGPIRLLGWSFGGSMALLIAEELTRRGRDVSHVGMLDARTDVADDTVFDAAAVLAGLLREMGFPVDPGARMTVREAVALVRESGDAIAILDDDQIAMVIENYVAAERLTAAADYGRYDGDVFFVDAAILEMDLAGVASAGWHDHVGGELRVATLECRHSELMDSDTLEQLGPLIAAELER
ncbi:non-ribosomal peptide synthetase [Mycolicibacterium sp. P9-64]|uniref:non-ribosomal peptide synthase/polyketide synthase n=1 Tax=Mycolicibacterium sp. P9-64 TaxID=2024612 RepID=UPI0011EDCE7A|nr:non-ribosomal peptide synthetase [Mycolicibacterium sp. P9-64]KAA0084465.1 non-ribosomal peptide synthetase [Mycolicibacterium sp. P9-64]